MKYLSEISKQFSRLFTPTELGDIGSSTSPYSVTLTVTVGSAYTFSINGVCNDTLHQTAGDRWYFYGLFEYLRNIFTDYDLSISNVTFTYVAHDLSETEDDTTITESDSILFCIDKVTGLTAEQYLRQHTITSTNVGYINSDTVIPINMYVFYNEIVIITFSTKAKIYYFDDDGDIQTHTIDYTRGSGLRSIDIFIPSTIDPAKVIKVVFTCNNRTYTLYNLQEPKVETFRFRNRWNVLETVIIPCSIEQHPSTEFELATCNDINVAYDIEHRTEHELKSAPIHIQLYETLLQLCRSQYVEYLTPSGYQRININEYDLPRSSAPNSLITLEMTFEMADNTPTVNLS